MQEERKTNDISGIGIQTDHSEIQVKTHEKGEKAQFIEDYMKN